MAKEHWRAQIITTAAFVRPKNPKECDIKRYHVWRWAGDSATPPEKLKCQCGLLDIPPRLDSKPTT